MAKVTDDDYYTSGSSVLKTSAARRKGSPTTEERLRSRRLWRRDISVAQENANYLKAAAVLARQEGRTRTVSIFGARHMVAGLADAAAGRGARVRFVNGAIQKHRACRASARTKGVKAHRFFVTAVPHQFKVAEGELSKLNLSWIRATVLRWVGRLPRGTYTSGLIEITLDEEQGAVPASAWTPHVHFIVELVAPTRKAARVAIETAFPVKKHVNSGVHTPIVIKRVWWLRGVLRYLSKGLQLHRAERRVKTYREDGGGVIHKRALRKHQENELVIFLESIDARNLVVSYPVIRSDYKCL